MEDELRELEQEELDKELLSTGTRAQDLPEVPTVDIKAPASGEKKKGKTNTTNHRIKYFQLISELFFFLVAAKSIEDDDGMKTLLSWAN